MSFAVVHMQKFSRGSIRGIQSHNQREKPSHTNSDIDYTRSGKNYDILNAQKINYHREITSRLEHFRNPGQRAIRKDAVVLCNFIISSDQAFFQQLSPEDTRAFFEKSVNFFAARYGIEAIVNATVHLDETTPHMHLGLVPLIDGRLSAKDLFNKRELQSLQTDFVQEVGAAWGLERGVMGSERTHLSEQQFKEQKAKEKAAQAEQEAEQAADKARKTVLEAKKALKALNTLDEQKNCLQEQIEGFQGVLKSCKEIDEIGEKSGILGKKLMMQPEEAEELKAQAKAYLTEKTKTAALQDRLEHAESLANQVPELRKQIVQLTYKLTRKKEELQDMKKIMRSSPELCKAYNDQVAVYNAQIDQKAVPHPNRESELER